MKQFIEATNRRQALKKAPWACRLAKVCGGYMAFEYETDYQVWKRQR